MEQISGISSVKPMYYLCGNFKVGEGLPENPSFSCISGMGVTSDHTSRCTILCMVYLTRLEHFNAAHKLYNPGWSKEKNEAVFGKCANENWHGHNYELYVTIKGDPDPDTGFLFDVKKLSLIIKDEVIEKVDHKNLNLDVDFLEGKMCSTENLAIGIWQQLIPHLPPQIKLHCIKLYETSKIYVEYFGD